MTVPGAPDNPAPTPHVVAHPPASPRFQSPSSTCMQSIGDDFGSGVESRVAQSCHTYVVLGLYDIIVQHVFPHRCHNHHHGHHRTHTHTMVRHRSHPVPLCSDHNHNQHRIFGFRFPICDSIDCMHVLLGDWKRGEADGCATTCGVGAGLSGTPGTVDCTTLSCDPDTKPASKQCPETVDCGALYEECMT